jgi:hypothetical protein
MAVSSTSFWQADQNWQNSQQAWAQQFSNSTSLTSVLTSALQNQASGQASIANARALDRVNSQIAAAQSGTTGSTSSSPPAAAAPAAAPSVPTYTGYLASTDSNSLSGATAASLLAGEVPIGSILSFLA